MPPHHHKLICHYSQRCSLSLYHHWRHRSTHLLTTAAAANPHHLRYNCYTTKSPSPSKLDPNALLSQALTQHFASTNSFYLTSSQKLQFQEEYSVNVQQLRKVAQRVRNEMRMASRGDITQHDRRVIREHVENYVFGASAGDASPSSPSTFNSSASTSTQNSIPGTTTTNNHNPTLDITNTLLQQQLPHASKKKLYFLVSNELIRCFQKQMTPSERHRILTHIRNAPHFNDLSTICNQVQEEVHIPHRSLLYQFVHSEAVKEQRRRSSKHDRELIRRHVREALQDDKTWTMQQQQEENGPEFDSLPSVASQICDKIQPLLEPKYTRSYIFELVRTEVRRFEREGLTLPDRRRVQSVIRNLIHEYVNREDIQTHCENDSNNEGCKDGERSFPHSSTTESEHNSPSHLASSSQNIHTPFPPSVIREIMTAAYKSLQKESIIFSKHAIYHLVHNEVHKYQNAQGTRKQLIQQYIDQHNLKERISANESLHQMIQECAASLHLTKRQVSKQITNYFLAQNYKRVTDQDCKVVRDFLGELEKEYASHDRFLSGLSIPTIRQRMLEEYPTELGHLTTQSLDRLLRQELFKIQRMKVTDSERRQISNFIGENSYFESDKVKRTELLDSLQEQMDVPRHVLSYVVSYLIKKFKRRKSVIGE